MTNDQAMAAGREIGGFPKKLGEISFDEGAVFSARSKSPTGLRSAAAELDAPAADTVADDDRPMTFFSLRVIPNPSDPTKPSSAS